MWTQERRVIMKWNKREKSIAVIYAIAAFVFIPAIICKKKDRAFRNQKIKELNLVEEN